MKRYKRIVALLVVLAVACTATFVAMRWKKDAEEIAVSGETVLSVEPDSVSAISWEREGETLSFHRDDAWLYDGDEAFPVDGEAMEALLETFADFKAAFVIENVEDYAQYGLDEPECTIELTTGDDTMTIKLGDYSQMDEQRYVDLGDGNVYLASEDPLDPFEAQLSDFILNDTIPSFTDVSQIAFSGSENYTIEYEADSGKSYSVDDVYFTQDGGVLDSSLVSSYLGTVSALSGSPYATYNATQEELEEYGMNDPELTVTVEYTPDAEVEDGSETAPESESFVLYVARAPQDRTEEPETDAAESESAESVSTSDTAEAEEDERTAYFRVGDSQIVYTIDGDTFDTLIDASYNALRHQEIFWGDFSAVTQIDVSLEGNQHSITSQAEDDTRTYSYNDETIDISRLQSALENLTADEFTDEAADGEEEIALMLHLDNESVPTVDIRITRYDGERCLVSIDGVSSALVDRTSAMTLVEAVQAIVL